jgi:beta-lactamase class A
MDIRRNRSTAIILLPLCLLLPFLLAAVRPAAAANTPGDQSSGTDIDAVNETAATPIETQLKELAEGSYGSYGVYLNILETGEQAGYGEDETFYAASCYKLFMVMNIYESAARGVIDLDRSITYRESDVAGETGIIQHMPLGTSLTTRELCRYAIAYSDNVAARMLRRVYGYHPYRDYAASIGCPVSGRYGGNLTTAREMGITLMRVLQFADTNPLGQEVISFMTESALKSRIPTGLPDGVTVGNKTGDYQGYANDVAVIFLEDITYILCILSKGGAGDALHAKASRLVYEDILRRHYGEGDFSAVSYRPQTQWFFTEVCTRERFETWLCLGNAEKGNVQAVLKTMDDLGKEREFRISVPPESTMSLRVSQLAGKNLDLTMDISSDSPIKAELVTYLSYKGRWTLSDSEARSIGRAREFYIADVSTREGFEAWLYLVNLGPGDSNCTISAMTSAGQTAKFPVVIPARGRKSLLLNDLIASDPDICLCVLSDTPVVAEKVVYLK